MTIEKQIFELIEKVNAAIEAHPTLQLVQSHRYGQKQRFVAFDVRIVNPEGTAFWLSVPNAHDVCEKLGIEFVHYARVSADLAVLDAERDAPSEQARRNGVEGERFREGVVLRPLIELTRNDGERVIVKHKRDDERETASPRVVDDPDRLKVLDDAEAIAVEWVTPTRLQHVLDKLPTAATTMADTPLVVAAMQEDVLREGAGELVDSRAARAAIGKATVRLFKAYVAEVERENRSLDVPETPE